MKEIILKHYIFIHSLNGKLVGYHTIYVENGLDSICEWSKAMKNSPHPLKAFCDLS